MLRKLIIYELRATSRTTIPILFVMLIVSLFPFFGVYEFITVFAMIAIFIVFFINNLVRYYKSFFKKDAYFTFNLPITAGNLLICKVVTGFIWSLLALIIVGCLTLVYVLSTPNSGVMLSNFFGEKILHLLMYSNYGILGTIFAFRFITRDLEALLSIRYTIDFILMSASMLTSKFLICYLAISSVASKKHRIIKGIGVYILINIVLILIRSIAVFIGFVVINKMRGSYEYIICIYILIYIAFGTICYKICRNINDKKLNAD